MFITLSMIVSPRFPQGLTGIRPLPGSVPASASSSLAASSTLCRSREHSLRGAGRIRQSACHAASDDWLYMKPTSWVGVRS